MKLTLNTRSWTVAAGRSAALAMLFALAACAGSSRLGPGPFADAGPGGRFGSSGAGVGAADDDVEPVTPGGPGGQVMASPLPPPPGASAAPSPVAPGAPDQGLGQGGAPGPVAALPSAPPQPAPTSRTALTGGWSAREATGGSCRVSLSSSPSLDLYKASTSGCSNKDLQSVNAWDLRDGEVYLYSRGTVVARLKGSGGSYSGVVAKSGAPLTLSR